MLLMVLLHQNNLRPMCEKWPHGEQARWRTRAEKFNILEQPAVISTLASQVAIGTSKGSDCHDGAQALAEDPRKARARASRSSRRPW
jgi:hypothetical protein